MNCYVIAIQELTDEYKIIMVALRTV